jgi:hypothetical protein
MANYESGLLDTDLRHERGHPVGVSIEIHGAARKIRRSTERGQSGCEYSASAGNQPSYRPLVRVASESPAVKEHNWGAIGTPYRVDGAPTLDDRPVPGQVVVFLQPSRLSCTPGRLHVARVGRHGCRSCYVGMNFPIVVALVSRPGQTRTDPACAPGVCGQHAIISVADVLQEGSSAIAKRTPDSASIEPGSKDDRTVDNVAKGG